jgi:hypothetical protein
MIKSQCSFDSQMSAASRNRGSEDRLQTKDFHFRRMTLQWYRLDMKIDALEREVLRLAPEERARLAELLLSSLDG